MFQKKLKTWLIVLALLITPFTMSNAFALCAAPTELGQLGEWKNIYPYTKSITRAVLGFACGDVILNGKKPYTGYQIRLFGACHPTDCDWGKANITPYTGGWYRTTIYHGYATRYVWVKRYTYWGNDYLRVWIWTDFASPSRMDYASNNWFVPQ